MKTIRFLSILITVLLIVVVWVNLSSLNLMINSYLIKIMKPMSSYGLNFPLISLTIGAIPFLSYLAIKKRPDGNMKLYIAYCIISICILILGCIFAFILADNFVKPTSPFLPEYIVWLPFPNYWNLIVPSFALITPLILILMSSRKSSKYGRIQ